MSQINTNTIANEPGTGGPDFVGMPSVGGDPVVESGSNSDGEWTRWADGTQHCSLYLTIHVDSSSLGNPFGDTAGVVSFGRQISVLPAAFIDTNYRAVGCYNDVAIVPVGGNCDSKQTTQARFWALNIGNGNVTMAYSVHGRWK